MKPNCILLAALLALAPSCTPRSQTGQSQTAQESSIDIQGAGATFPYPLYSKWIAEYQKLDPRVRINYQSIGSGGGIRQILERTVDFGATDAVMTEAELGKSSGRLLHLPMTLGAVVVSYNLPGLSSGLKLTPEALSGLFLGEIKRWDDPRLARLNPELKLPAEAVTVVHRSDGSGTTAVFTEYLSAVSAAWKEKVGAGKSVKFPTGLGAKGNEGVAGQIKTTPGSLGYLELAYAKQTGLAYAAIRNRDGKFVEPSLEGITAAAAGATIPDDLRVSIVDAPGPSTYPLSAFSYILVYEELSDPRKGRALAQFLRWAIHDGQRFGPKLHYAPLPKAVVEKIEAKLRNLRSDGKALLGEGAQR